MRAWRGTRRGTGPIGTVVVLAVVSGALGCVIETERAPRQPLLRDTLRAAPSAPTMPAPAPLPNAFRACEKDADCVAVLPNGCCHDGRNEAMNKTLVDVYRSTFTCPLASPPCLPNLVLDRRVAACDVPDHTCKLVEPAP
jgi:hypothetical protein